MQNPRDARGRASLPAACSDDDKIVGPSDDGVEAQTVALVELEGTRPAFFLQKSNGAGRTRVHFSGAVDEIPGNSPLVPALTDANILALRSVKWSPDASGVHHGDAAQLARPGAVRERRGRQVGTGPEQLLVDGGQLDHARLTTDDVHALLMRGGTSFIILDSFGANSRTIRESGADQLSADLRVQ